MKAVGHLIALVILISIIAIIAPTFGGDAPSGARPPGIPILPRSLLIGILGGVAALAVLSAAGVLRHYFAAHRMRLLLPFLPDRQMTLLVLIWVSVLLSAFFIGALILSFMQFEEEEPSGAPGGQREGTPGIEEIVEERDLSESELQTSETSDRSRRLLLFAFLVVVAIGVLVWAFRVYRSAPRVSTEEIDSDTALLRRNLKSASRESLAGLLETADNRTAVIAAYAIMYDCFLEQGYSPSPSQTPHEFMEKVVRSLKVSWPLLPDRQLLRLTTLYELAKFSDHPIAETHRASAVNCLREIENSL